MSFRLKLPAVLAAAASGVAYNSGCSEAAEPCEEKNFANQRTRNSNSCLGRSVSMQQPDQPDPDTTSDGNQPEITSTHTSTPAQQAYNTAAAVMHNVSEKVSNLAATAQQTASEVSQRTKELAAAAWDTTAHAAETAKEKAGEAGETVRSSAQAAVESAKETAQQAAERTRQEAEAAREKGKSGLAQVVDSAKGVAEGARSTFHSAAAFVDEKGKQGLDAAANAVGMGGPSGSKSKPPSSNQGEMVTPGEIPGESKELKTRVLGAGTAVLQGFAPVKQIHQHVCAFHIYADDLTRQVTAHHYCSHVNQDFRQCVIYDSDKPDARLIGIEYIITRKLYEGLPDDEKKFWHSHKYEVMSGTLVAPNVPEAAERAEMQTLVDTYGKTWHTWQVDRGDALPLGPPQLMMAFTGDGQVDPQLIAARDEYYGISTEEKRQQRRDLEYPPQTHPAADHWQSGSAWQVAMEKVPFKSKDTPAARL